MNYKDIKSLLFFSMVFLLISVASTIIILWTWSYAINSSYEVSNDLYRETQTFLLRTINTQVNEMLKTTNTSTINLANIVTATVKGDFSSFHTIQKQVAPALFLAYSAVPYLSQASYIGSNGLIFSYHRELNRTRAIFSNSSWYFDVENLTSGYVLNHSSRYHWYGEFVDESTGILQGNYVDLSHLLMLHSYWIQALQHNEQSLMIGPELASDGNQSFLFNAPIMAGFSDGHRGIISLGISANHFINYYIRDNGIQDVGIYLAMKDGQILTKRDCSTYSFHVDRSILQEAWRFACEHSSTPIINSSYLELNGTMCMIHCIQLSIGNPMVFLVSLPHKDIMRHVHGVNVMVLVTLAMVLIIAIFVNCITYRLTRRYQKITSFLHASLIKCKEALQQAERKSMNKSLAFASSSHDIRTSLAGISGLIELCRHCTSPGLDLHTYLEQMDTCASHLLGILNSILDTSKMEAGKIQLEEFEFDLSKVLEESVDIFHIIALNKGLELIWDPCDFSVFTSSMVIGDCQRFRQILDNLLGNAVKFTQEGHIVLRAWARKRDLQSSRYQADSTYRISNIWNPLGKLLDRDDYSYRELEFTNDGTNFVEFVFEVNDSGIGIPKEKRAHVFENYVQISESTTGENIVGTGLGLGIVQSYVRLMGGEINIVDKDMNANGTCFRFNIFLKQVESPANLRMDRSLSYSQLLNKLHGLYALHFVQGPQTQEILNGWMKKFGAKVLEINGMEHFIHSVENIKHGLAYGHFYYQEKNNPMSQKVLFKHPTCGSYAEDARGSPLNEVLSTKIIMIIDMSCRPLLELISILGDFSKCANRNHCKIICLRDSKVPSTEIRRLMDRDILCDLILEKPFHGSRIYKALEVLQESKPTSVEEEKPAASTVSSREKYHAISTDSLVSDKPLAGWNILIVEDNHIMYLVASNIISRLGANIQVAENGEVAVKLVREALDEFIAGGDVNTDRMQRKAGNFPYHLILMDCKMPKMDGYEAVKQIRMEEKSCGIHIPIIALSAHEEERGHMSIDAGMDLHMSKPISKESLLDAIQALNISR